MILDPPLFPHRDFVDDAARRRAEETLLGGSAGPRSGATSPLWTRRGTIFALEHWVRGGTFHDYGVRAIDALEADLGIEEAVRELASFAGYLTIEGAINKGFGGMRWSATYRRAGGIVGEYGGCSGYSTPEDAAYACLEVIEAHEREAYLENLVVGVA